MMQVNRDVCCYCGGCVGVCPRDALELRETILFIDQSKCSGCGICMKFCPVDAIRNENLKSGV
jgi:MinD superfamily P-loop ATPase